MAMMDSRFSFEALGTNRTVVMDTDVFDPRRSGHDVSSS